MTKRDDDLFRGSEPLKADNMRMSDKGDTEKKDGLLGGDADQGDDDASDEKDADLSDAKDTDSDTDDARSWDDKKD